MPETKETDRHGREVLRDKYDMRYVVDDGIAFYITDCCDASGKGSLADGAPAVLCRCCLREVAPEIGALPEPKES